MYSCLLYTRNRKEMNEENAVPLLKQTGEDGQRNIVI